MIGKHKRTAELQQLLDTAHQEIGELHQRIIAKDVEIAGLRRTMARGTLLQEWDALRSVPIDERSLSQQRRLEWLELELGFVDEPHPHVGVFRVVGGHGFRSNT